MQRCIFINIKFYIFRFRIMWVTIVGLVLHGLGIAAQLVASFTDALRTTVCVETPNY
jgi:hypothetical protein